MRLDPKSITAWYRAVGFRYPRRPWLIAAVALAFSLVNCTAILTPHRLDIPCEPVDPDLSGCFVHVAGRDSGWMMVRQRDCDQVEGEARGFSEIGPPPHDAWVFSGTIESAPEEEGVAKLVARWDGEADDQALEAIHRVTPEERLILRREGGVVQVELARCP